MYKLLFILFIIRNVPIEDEEIMVSFDVTSLYTNKDYVNNNDRFTRKTATNSNSN